MKALQRLHDKCVAMFAVTRYDGIIIASMMNRKDLRDAEFLVDALRLLASADPRRYRTFQREVHSIVFMPLGGARATYVRWGRRCAVDATAVGARWGNHHDWYVARLASTLVHEATHGRIHSLCP